MTYGNFPNQQLFDLKMGYKRLQQQLKRLEAKEVKTPFDLQRISALKKQMEDLRGQVGGLRER